MRIDPKDAKAGDAVTWKGNGLLFQVLSRILAIIDYKTHWDRWAWHTGYIVRILEGGEVVTSQAVAKGVESITYSSVNEMGDCRIYRWLDNPDQEHIDEYTAQHNGLPYDALDYLWVFLGGISMIYFKHPFRMENGWVMCWENLAEFCRWMCKELQPGEEPCLISRIVKRLEGKDI